jgi:large subunit ribosomal protein L35
MGYKFKPNKGAKKRLRVTKTGKLKFSHEMNSHLRSNRTAQKKRHLGRPGVLAEATAGRLRKLMGIVGSRPAQTAHERALAAKEAAKEAAPTEPGKKAAQPAV